MLLMTSILPRRDGTVVAAAADGEGRYTFRADASGALVCDVDDEATIALLLKAGHCYPARKADYAAAMAITGEDAEGEGDDLELDDDGAEDEGDPNAPPDEAGTIPVPLVPRLARRKRGG